MPRSVMTDAAFQAFLDVLRIEQVMGLRMFRVRDLPFYADFRVSEPHQQLSGVMYQEFHEVLFIVHHNTFSDAPEFDSIQVLSLLQAEEVAAMFGCRPRLDMRSALVASSLGDYTAPPEWERVFTTLLSHPNFDAVPTEEKADALALVSKLLTQRWKRQGHLRGTTPEEIWRLLCQQLRLPTPE